MSQQLASHQAAVASGAAGQLSAADRQLVGRWGEELVFHWLVRLNLKQKC